MSDVTEDGVRSAFEDAERPSADGYEVLNVERNRSQYRVFLANPDVTREEAEGVLDAAFGSDSVFGLSLTDDMAEGGDQPVRVVTFRLR